MGGRGKNGSDSFHSPPLFCLCCSSSHSCGHLAAREKEPFSPVTSSPETTSGSTTELSVGKAGMSSDFELLPSWTMRN